MKQKIKNLTQLVLIICVLLISTNCSNDEILVKPKAEQATTINDAKQWFDNYKSSKKIYYAFENQTYNWEQAKLEKLGNGLEAIKVPASNSYANNEYTGKRILYLYAGETGKGFQTTLYDIITKRQDSNDLNNFSGYIIAWNFETGFANGLKFENNKSLTSIAVEEFFKGEYNPHKQTGKAPPLPILHLDEVVIDGGGGSDTGTSINVRDFSIGSSFDSGSGISASSYTAGPQGGGGGNGGNSGSSVGTSSIKSKTQLIAVINSTDVNGKDFKFLQSGNTIVSSGTIGLLPWVQLVVSVTQTKIGDKYIVNNVVSNPIGLTTGISWAQSAYGQVTNGNTTTITIVGISSVTLFFESVGNVYSSPVTYTVNIDNKTGKLISAKRLAI